MIDIFVNELKVWEMVLLAKLQWDVSGVTAFDFVDQLMERLPLCRAQALASPVTSSAGDVTSKPQLRSSSNNNINSSSSSNNNNNNTLVRGHALTYVSLCCTGKSN